MNRRQMIKTVAGVSAAAMVPAFSCSPKEKVMADKQFKIGACDWTIGKMCDPEALRVAIELGLDGVQISLGTLENDFHLRQKEVQQKYLDAAKQYGTEIGSLAIGALNSYPLKSDERALQWVMDSIDVCKTLSGTPVVLLAFFDKGELRNDPQGIDVVVQKLKEAAPHAEQQGITLAIESYLNAEEHLDILERVNSPAVKVYYDVGNSKFAGYDIFHEIPLLGKNIVEFHAKDHEDLYGKGSMDFPKVREAMDEIGYKGWIHIEGIKTPLGMEKSIAYDANYLRTIFI